MIKRDPEKLVVGYKAGVRHPEVSGIGRWYLDVVVSLPGLTRTESASKRLLQTIPA